MSDTQRSIETVDVRSEKRAKRVVYPLGLSMGEQAAWLAGATVEDLALKAGAEGDK